jgi:hypothetical protein
MRNQSVKRATDGAAPLTPQGAPSYLAPAQAKNVGLYLQANPSRCMTDATACQTDDQARHA